MKKCHTNRKTPENNWYKEKQTLASTDKSHIRPAHRNSSPNGNHQLHRQCSTLKTRRCKPTKHQQQTPTNLKTPELKNAKPTTPQTDKKKRKRPPNREQQRVEAKCSGQRQQHYHNNYYRSHQLQPPPQNFYDGFWTRSTKWTTHQNNKCTAKTDTGGSILTGKKPTMEVGGINFFSPEGSSNTEKSTVTETRREIPCALQLSETVHTLNLWIPWGGPGKSRIILPSTPSRNTTQFSTASSHD